MLSDAEVERVILRAHRRNQDLMRVLGNGIAPDDLRIDHEGIYGKDLNPLVLKPNLNLHKAPGIKGNQLVTHSLSELLYPVKPPRSVYNSPLIKTNRGLPWDRTSSLADRDGLLAQHSQTNEEAQGTAPQKLLSEELQTTPISSFPLEGVVKSANAFLSPFSNLRLYPSLPRSVQSEAFSVEERKLKNTSNCSTVTVMNSGDFQNHSKWDGRNLKNVCDESPKVNSTEFNSAQSTVSEDDSSVLNDLEDTCDMDRFLEEALGSSLNMNSTVNDEKALVSSASDWTKAPIHTTNTLQSSMRLVDQNVICERSTTEVGQLFQQAEIQQQLISQASKALTVCRSSKAFLNSVSLVDAERLLLLATLRHKAALNEIKYTIPASIRNSLHCKGQLRVLKVSVPLKGDCPPLGKSDHEKDLWFLCVLSHGLQVLASEAVPYEAGSKYLVFSNILELIDLPETFVALLQIYSLRTYKPELQSHKSKISKACQLLRRKSRLCLGQSPSSEHLLHLRTPAFALSGTASIDLKMATVLEPQSLHLVKVPIMSPLRESVQVKMETTLTSSLQRSGFLTVLEGLGGSHAWQRRWCLLKELSLYFWNYPGDQDEKEPLDVINLESCSCEKVQVAPRNLCARRRTIMLESIRSSSPSDLDCTMMECHAAFTVMRIFLSCDSAKDMNEWTSTLDQVLSAIQVWKMRTKN